MSRIAGHQLQAVHQGDGGDHRIGQTNGLADAFEVTPDAARHLGGRLAEFQHFFTADMGEQGRNLLGSLDLLEALDHLHDGDDGEGEVAIRLVVAKGIGGNSRVHGSEDFGIDIRIEQGFIHPV